MIEREKNSKTGKLLTFIILTVVVLGVLSFLLKIGKDEISENDGSNDEITDEGSSEVDEIIEAEEIPSETSESYSGATRLIKLFIDKDKDRSLGAGEEICAHCSGMKVIATELTYGEIYPGEADLTIITVKDKGLIDENELITANTLWGYSLEKDLLIPETAIALNDGAAGLNIPVWEVDVNLSGVNANIAQIDWSDTDGKIIIELSKLIPSLQAVFDEQKDIWVYFYPNKGGSDVIYIGKGKIKQDNTSEKTETQTIYYLESDWQVPDQYSTIMDKKNIGFILL